MLALKADTADRTHLYQFQYLSLKWSLQKVHLWNGHCHQCDVSLPISLLKGKESQGTVYNVLPSLG